MNTIFFKYKEHPSDLFKITCILPLPDPNLNLDDFLEYFLEHYSSDSKVTYLDELFRLLYNEFSDEKEEEKFIKMIGHKTENEIKEEIKLVENELINDAYKNFYNLILKNEIEIIIDGEK